MKKCYKTRIGSDELEEVEKLTEALEDIGAEGIWLETEEMTILLPPELAVCLEKAGILGLA
jgi:hypothetical protein